jgi:phosphonate transport system substrate-binding protein
MAAWRGIGPRMRSGVARARLRFDGGSSCRRLAVLALIWLIGGAVPAASALAAEADPAHGYRFGVFPYLPALTIDRIFGPIAASFATALGRPVHLKTKPTFKRFAYELEHATYDIVFVHPFFYVHAADRQGYLPLARLEGQLSALVLVRSERPWRSWADLEGKTIGAPPALATVSVLTEASLREAGLIPGIDTTLEHYRTKMSCLQAVLAGGLDACVLPRFALAQIGGIGEGQLRVLVETHPVNHLVFAAHPRLPETERENCGR